MNQLFIVVIILLLRIICVLSVKTKIECGYKQCPQTRDGALNVHLIAHSHMDAGWVKTFDEYYYGTKTTISTANVQLIYHSVLSELLHDKRRKFTLSETAYFWRWWKEQRPTTRATFRSLVQEGRVEFAGGGWVQNDEATPDYLQIIDQYTWGLRKLNDTLGPCGKPKAAWQIDTYGHSREQASLLAQMGFDGLFLGRIDHKEREAMIEEDRLEFMWRGSDVLGKMSDIMSHVLFNLYNAPEGFCFDFLCNDEPIIDDPDNHVYNADKRVNDFITQIEKQAKYYDHDNIMVTMGGDFTYQSAANWFMNMDKLINHVSSHPANISDINIFYSTPSCYLKAIYLYGRRDKAIYTERGDHFPYGSDSLTYWTGFYTSRPSLKYLARRAHVLLQVVKQLTVIARMTDSYELHLLRNAVSLVLHHDAITGTSQQHVANDFIRILSEAVEICIKKASSLLSHLTPTWGVSRRSKNNQQFTVCLQLNMSQCRFAETQETMLLLVYNPLSVKTYFHVRLPAIALHYTIRDFNDEEVEYQLVSLPAAAINLPGRGSTAIQEICFEAENIPPLGFTAYYIAPIRDQLEENQFAKKSSQAHVDMEDELVPFISNEYLKVMIDKNTGLLASIQHVDGVRIDVSQNFFFYSQNQQTLQSGAYSFRPDRQRPTPVTDRASYNTVRGSLVKEIRQRFSDWVTQTIRLYRGEEYVELEWIIGPVPIGTDLGKEVVSLFTTNVTNNGEFFTDSNSRQMVRRTCWNETASQQQKKPVAACYYPVSSRICIHSINGSVEMCVLTDRAQGGTSYNDGEIELLVHRRLLTDDGFGLEETLNEEAFGAGLVIEGKHRIIFGNFKQEVDDQTFSERISSAVRKWQYEPWLFFTSGEKINRRKWQNVRNKRYSALRLHGLPRHVHVLTLEPWKAGSVLLRLENTLEKPIRDRYRTDKTDGPEDFNSKPTHITVELRKIFLQMQIKRVRETTLAANQWLDDARQMDWSTRYVYNGADDGLLTEDAEETIDKSSKQSELKDTAHYNSYEEQDYAKKPIKGRPRSKAPNKVRSKLKRVYDEYERRKRSLNTTEYAEGINNTIIKYNNTKIVNTSIEEINGIQNASTVKEIPIKSEVLAATKKTPRLNFPSKSRPNKEKDQETEEISSSEEDFSSNIKKRLPRKKYGSRNSKRQKQDEIIIDDSDDGITKSIYDMYYRQKARNPFRVPKKFQNESRRKKLRKKNDYEDDTVGDRTRHGRGGRKNMRKSDMPFFLDVNRGIKDRKFLNVIRNKEKLFIDEDGQTGSVTTGPLTRARRNYGSSGEEDEKMSYEDDDEDYDEDEDLENTANERNATVRKKRTLPKEDQTQGEPINSEENEQSESDYVVTLRPTQIRTFIIWFETTKKSYVL